MLRISSKTKLSDIILCITVLLFLSSGVAGDDATPLECENVKPIWDKISGKPRVTLDQSSNSEVKIEWKQNAILYGKECVQAFNVEQKQFGKGRRNWSLFWSSLVRCGHIIPPNNRGHSTFQCTMTLSNFDCGKRIRFRVILHNIYNVKDKITPSEYEEVYIQCKQVYDPKVFLKLRPKLSPKKHKKIFFVRTANKSKYKATKIGVTTRPIVRRRKTTTTTMSTKTTPTTSATTASTIITTTHSTPSTSSTEQTFKNVTKFERISEARFKRKRIFLIPGERSIFQRKDRYEVRHNLKNFMPQRKEMRYCGKYLITDIARDCDIANEIHRGEDVCFFSTQFHKIPRSEKGFFKMSLDPRCGGDFKLINVLQNCQEVCEDKNIFVIA